MDANSGLSVARGFAARTLWTGGSSTGKAQLAIAVERWGIADAWLAESAAHVLRAADRTGRAVRPLVAFEDFLGSVFAGRRPRYAFHARFKQRARFLPRVAAGLAACDRAKRVTCRRCPDRLRVIRSGRSRSWASVQSNHWRGGCLAGRGAVLCGGAPSEQQAEAESERALHAQNSTRLIRWRTGKGVRKSYPCSGARQASCRLFGWTPAGFQAAATRCEVSMVRSGLIRFRHLASRGERSLDPGWEVMFTADAASRGRAG